MNEKPTPAPNDGHAEIMAALKKLGGDQHEFQRTAGGVLDRLLPMGQAADEKLDALTSSVGNVKQEIEVMKRRLDRLEKHTGLGG